MRDRDGPNFTLVTNKIQNALADAAAAAHAVADGYPGEVEGSLTD